MEGGGDYGRQGVRRAVDHVAEDWDSVTYEVREGHDAGDRAVAHIRTINVGAGGGPEVTWELWLVLRFRDGLITYGRALLDRDEAFRGAGLADQAPGSRREASTSASKRWVIGRPQLNHRRAG